MKQALDLAHVQVRRHAQEQRRVFQILDGAGGPQLAEVPVDSQRLDLEARGRPQAKRGVDGSWHIAFDLWPTGHRFAAGHRLRLQVSSGAHPRYARNPGTGEDPITATTLKPVEIEILHDREHPSALTLGRRGVRDVPRHASSLVRHEAGVVTTLRVAEVAALPIERRRMLVVPRDDLSRRVQEAQVRATRAAVELARAFERRDGLARRCRGVSTNLALRASRTPA